jgi:hypothetical protein
MSKITQRVNELQNQVYSVGFPAYSIDILNDLTEKFTRELTKKINKQVDEYFEPFIRKTGVKGNITKGKLKWRGIKMHIYYHVDCNVYQLNQRGVKISPRLKVDFFGVITYPISNN